MSWTGRYSFLENTFQKFGIVKIGQKIRNSGQQQIFKWAVVCWPPNCKWLGLDRLRRPSKSLIKPFQGQLTSGKCHLKGDVGCYQKQGRWAKLKLKYIYFRIKPGDGRQPQIWQQAQNTPIWWNLRLVITQASGDLHKLAHVMEIAQGFDWNRTPFLIYLREKNSEQFISNLELRT